MSYYRPNITQLKEGSVCLKLIMRSLANSKGCLKYGSIIPLAFNKNSADIGNFTLPEYRMNGVGRSLIIHLSEIAKSQNLTPVCGCWYGNTESIATLQSSGFIPNSRIFYIKFK